MTNSIDGSPIIDVGDDGEEVLGNEGIFRLGTDSSAWPQNDKAGGGRLGDTEDLNELWHLPPWPRFFASGSE